VNVSFLHYVNKPTYDAPHYRKSFFVFENYFFIDKILQGGLTPKLRDYITVVGSTEYVKGILNIRMI
jgi:hypothetical protein